MGAISAREAIRQMKERKEEMTISTGHSFEFFPTITKMTRGFQGIFVLSAAAKVGKSTLGTQLAADLASEDYHGVYCDLENKGRDTIRRFSLVRGDDHPRLDYLLYTRKLDEAINALKLRKSGFLVIDTLNTSVGSDFDENEKLTGLIASQMNRLNALSVSGYDAWRNSIGDPTGVLRR